MTTKPIRHYLMAVYGKRRTPTRVSKAKRAHAFAQAREWWEVSSPTAKEARTLCMAWPLKVAEGQSRITNHGRNRN